jgi:hypothetical protein
MHAYACIFASISQSTRVLQTICAVGKRARAATIASQVPQVRRVLETFILRVKALLAKHNATAAFSVGVLKQKRLDGSELPQVKRNKKKEKSLLHSAKCRE